MANELVIRRPTNWWWCCARLQVSWWWRARAAEVPQLGANQPIWVFQGSYRIQTGIEQRRNWNCPRSAGSWPKLDKKDAGIFLPWWNENQLWLSDRYAEPMWWVSIAKHKDGRRVGADQESEAGELPRYVHDSERIWLSDSDGEARRVWKD